jgi:hypothetical protein
MAKVSQRSAALTADGGSNGILSIADTSAFVKGATLFLGAQGLPTVELEVAAILSPTNFAVKLKSSPSARYNSSGYTTALGATVVQPEQDVFTDVILPYARTGRATIRAGSDHVVVPNSLSNPNVQVQAWVQQAQADATLTHVVRTYPESGRFTIYGSDVATAATTVAWELK